ncbi:MAG: TlpA family protein disulfide reductase [Chloroflexi bacterium]|nr:TlpA family protein disulfide reductase [Chloroflexota bacterium]
MTTLAQPAPLAPRRFPFWLLFVAAAAFALLAALLLGQGQQDTARTAWDFDVTTLDGQRWHLADLRGQVVLLNFWATWCTYCEAEMAELQSLWGAYEARGVVVLGVVVGDREARVRAFLDDHSITYPNTLDLPISEAYNIEALPVTILIDQNGLLVNSYYSAITAEQLRPEIEGLLAANAENG